MVMCMSVNMAISEFKYFEFCFIINLFVSHFRKLAGVASDPYTLSNSIISGHVWL